MTVAVSQAKGKGAEAIICASTGNTAASAAAYAARAGDARRGDRARGQDRAAASSPRRVMHGARVIALRGNFDQALELVKEIVERQPVELVNSINPYRIEGQKTAAFEVCDELGAAPDALAIPVGNAGNITAWWKGFVRVRAGPAAPLRLSGRGRRADRARPAGRAARDRRVGDPDRQPGALAGGAGCARGVGRPHRRGQRRARSSRRSGGWRRTRACSASRPPPRAWPACSSAARGGAARVRAHRPRSEGPRDRDRARARGGRLRSRARRGRAGGARTDGPPAQGRACPAPRRTWGPASTRWRPRSRCTWSSRWRRRASSRSTSTTSGLPRRRDQPVRARVRGPASGRRV